MAPQMGDIAAQNLLSIRDTAAQSASNALEGTSAAEGSAAGSSTYLGIGLGVGSAIVIAVVVVTVQILKKRKEHQRAANEPEEITEPVRVRRDVREVPRPGGVTRCGSLAPLQARAGWGALSSDESIYQPGSLLHPEQSKRNSISLPQRFKQRGIPLKRLKHLSAIIESPRSRGTRSPATEGQTTVHTPVKPSSEKSSYFKKTITLVHPAERDEDVFAAPGSPKLHVLPSFAIRSPGRYGADIANDDKPKVPRSVSVGAMIAPGSQSTSPKGITRPTRPQMHSRSVSLGAPPTRPPSGPVPPLPVAPQRKRSDQSSHRRGVCISRLSSSSQESASSSVLVTSPILTMRDDESKKIGSPCVEQLVAEDDSAELKAVVNRQWQNPRVTGCRSMDSRSMDTLQASDSTELPDNHASIRSNVARYSNYEGLADRRASTGSTASSDSGRNRLSIPQLGTADRVSISRVSSFNSLHSSSGVGVQQITTPRKPTRQSSVSASGSPAERRRTSVAVAPSALRDLQPNCVSNTATPSRQASTATENSGRSSNGNPFQWDQPLPLAKPSALKGSPNAKGTRGHRRQNCVRISTLTPQILGPPPGRLPSPGFMCGIQEEGDENSSPREVAALNYVNNLQQQQRLSRPPSESSLTRNLKVRTFRASLTPSSPTLSTWTAYQENHGAGLTTQNSESQLSVSPVARTTSRQSDRSSAFSIPSFPSPSKATVSGVQQNPPVPEVYFSRPSTDDPSPKGMSGGHREALGSSPPHASSDGSVIHNREEVFGSSPPLLATMDQEYDPAWPMPINFAPDERTAEYDPASPPIWNEKASELPGLESSSPGYFPFAINTGMGGPCSDDDQPVSPVSRPTSYGGQAPDTPPISPKTMKAPQFPTFFDSRPMSEEFSIVPRQTARSLRSTEKLTSANASAIMATIPESPPNVGFPTAVPVLAPPVKSQDPSTTPAGPRRQRTVSSAAPLVLQPLRAAPPPPPPLADEPEVPSPLKVRQACPHGPRSEPAKSVLKNAMELRRMNSEIDHGDRSSRRYTRLTREPSPLLPWIGSPDLSESYHDGFGNGLFDFDFSGLDAGAGAEEGGNKHQSALDDIDMSALDRRLDGALAGFEAGPPSSAATVTPTRTSSVWEDGEKFWEERPKISIPVSSPSLPAVVMTPAKRSAAPLTMENGQALATPQLKMPTPIEPLSAGRPPLSITKTPKSLYDSDGFLRSSPRSSYVM